MESLRKAPEPKSISLSSSDLVSTSKFSSLMSRWITPFLWQASTVSTTWKWSHVCGEKSKRSGRESHLAEKVPGEGLLEDALLCDEVEEVLARFGPLHDDDEGVVALKVVDEPDHAGDVGDAVHEADLQGHLVQSNLQEEERVSW